MRVGERCDCRQWPTKDGYRANCMRFKCRTTYKGKNYIQCGESKLLFDDETKRNLYYVMYCCNGGKRCQRCEGSAEV